MSQPLKSQQELYDLWITVLQNTAPQLTDLLDGSIIDGLAGVFSVAGLELQRYIVLQFNKTFIDLANGPEITLGPDDLQTLAVDHFGADFERPEATNATDTETFFRPNNNYGSLTILEGTIVKTAPDANGNQQRYGTNLNATLTAAGTQSWTVTSANATVGAVYEDANGNHYTVATTIAAQTTLATTGTTIPTQIVAGVTKPLLTGTLTKLTGTGDTTITYSSVSTPDCLTTVGITAVVAGSAGNASGGAISILETALLDSSVLVYNAGNQSGTDAPDDSDYRELIRNLIVSLRAATLAAVEAAALAVPGVATAVGIMIETPVIPYNIATGLPVVGAEWFYIPYPYLYIADSSGNASSTLIGNVTAALTGVRAYGVNINVLGAVTIPISWTAHYTLNPLGPNYATFSGNNTQILTSMTNYINTLGPGNSFVVATANAAILAIWGPAGTNDLTAFTTSLPTGDVAIATGQTAVANVVQTD